MGKPIVFDIETKRSFQEIDDRKPEKLGISMVGVYSYEYDTYRAFREHEFDEMFSWFERSSMLIGYNSHGFDIPALVPHYIGDLTNLPSLDLLESIKDSLGRRVALDEFAKETLGTKKSGHGLLAINYYKEGNWDALEKYCLDDVKLTKDLYEFGKEKGVIYFKAPFGRRAVKVQWHEPIKGYSREVPLTLGI